MADNLPLHRCHCMISRSKTLLMSILNSVVDINERRTPLHNAARKNDLEGIELLLERGADVNVKCKSGDTPLHEGINNYEVVKTLLDKGALPDCRNGRGQTPLFLAVRKKNLPVIDLLLSVDVDIDLEDCKGYSPLHEAVSNRSHEIIKILLDHGANIDGKKCTYSSTPLEISAAVNDCLITQLLLDNGANPNLIGTTPLHIAANHRFSSVIKVLLDAGANPNLKDYCGCAPLHISASLGDFKSVQILLEKGADINIKDHKENTPLRLAAKISKPLVIDIIIQGGAIVDTNNVEGNTALHEAVNSMVPENVKCLLQAGANVNAQNEKGETPLHLAVSKYAIRSLEVIQILLDWGASVKLTNNQSKTVLQVAYGKQRDLIKKHFVKLMPLNGSQFEVNVAIDLKGYESFHTSCLEELERLKKKKCGKYSFFDIFYLYNNPYYVNALSLENELSSFHTEFQIYGSLLKPTFKKAKKRLCVMQKLVKCFNLNCLPVELKWKILTYLNDESLEYILKIVETC